VLWTDNHGDSGTGRPEVAALFTLSDVSGIGEQYQARGAFSEGMRLGSFGAAAPLSATGVALRADYTYLTYDNITDLGEALGLEGHSRRVGFGADYALIRSRAFTLRLSLDYGRTTLVDESDTGRLSERRSKTGALRLWGDSRDGIFGSDGVNSFEARVTRGDLDLSRMPSLQAVDAAGLRTEGNFTRVNTSLGRVQSLPADFSLLVRAQAQWANKNLDSSEDFTLGGPYGVRAYPIGEARGDTGHLATLELRRNMIIAPAPGTFQVAGFLDTGRVQIHRDFTGVPVATATARDEYSLNGAGLSMRWSYRSTHASATLARTLGSNPGRSALDGSNSDGRHEQWPFWVQCAVRF
jgi:hemolysin activation/secretion protein